MLSELERKIFSDEAIAYLVEGINKNIQKQNRVDNDKKEVLVKELKEIDKQIDNIVTAITNGFVQEEFKIKMDELKGRKSDIEYKLIQFKSNELT